MNRRSFFGLFGGAAAVPFVKVPAVDPAPAGLVGNMSVSADTTVYGGTISTAGHPKLLWPGLDAVYGVTYKDR